MKQQTPSQEPFSGANCVIVNAWSAVAPAAPVGGQIAGDGGLKSAAVLLSVAASAKRHGVNPWAYVRHILSESAARPLAADFSDLLPDAWAQAGANS